MSDIYVKLDGQNVLVGSVLLPIPIEFPVGGLRLAYAPWVAENFDVYGMLEDAGKVETPADFLLR